MCISSSFIFANNLFVCIGKKAQYGSFSTLYFVDCISRFMFMWRGYKSDGNFFIYFSKCVEGHSNLYICEQNFCDSLHITFKWQCSYIDFLQLTMHQQLPILS